MTLEDLLPKIIDKSLMSKSFDPKKIHDSLLEETSLPDADAHFIMTEAIRFIVQISNKIKIMTSPMIREIVNVTLLKYGYEKERLQYTRIGLPFYDISLLPSTYNITRHVLEEYKNVQNIIKQLEEDKNGKE
jgi:anaerobic ribonucleoside-triphosphate reductase